MNFITLSGCWGRKSFMICYKSMFTNNAIFGKKIKKSERKVRKAAIQHYICKSRSPLWF